MKAGVILNGISLAKKTFYKNYLPLLQRDLAVEVFETRSVNDAVSIAARLVAKRFDIIIAAGGDGTVNQVVNGMLSEPEILRLPLLAVLPLGSGNDFARSLNLDNSPEPFCRRLRNGVSQAIDVGELICAARAGEPPTLKRFFVNVADVGMGPAVVRGVLESGRPFGSAVAYYQSIVKTFFTYRPKTVAAKGDDWEWRSEMRTLAMGNGKYYGNGLCIAPEARLDDGILEVFACGPVSVLDFILQTLPLKTGRKVRHRYVTYFKSSEIEISSPVPVEIEADGEIIGWLPAKVYIHPRRLMIAADHL